MELLHDKQKQNVKKDILILVEHVARELDIACLIKCILENKFHYRVHISSLPYYRYTKPVDGFSPSVIVTPFFYSIDSFHVVLGEFPEASVANLGYEQIFQNINENLKSPKDIPAKEYVMHHVWSEHSRDYLAHFGVRDQNLIINGNLSYSLYKEPYKNYFRKREELALEFQLDPRSRWVLIPENYAAAFYSDANIRERITKGINEDEVVHYRDFARNSLATVVKWISLTLTTYNGELIFRPRPAVPIQEMKTFFLNIESDLPKNLHMNKKYSVKEWILASDVVISSYSTTLIEASIAGKPIYMLEPILFPHYLQAPWYGMVDRISSLENFKEALQYPASDNYLALKNWAEVNMMKNSDTIKGAIDFIKEVERRQIKIPKQFIHFRKFHEFNEGFINKIKCLLKHVPIYILKKKNPDYEFDYFTKRDIDRRVSLWKDVLDMKSR